VADGVHQVHAKFWKQLARAKKPTKGKRPAAKRKASSSSSSSMTDLQHVSLHPPGTKYNRGWWKDLGVEEAIVQQQVVHMIVSATCAW
jgi:hypothetical protein